MTNLSSTFIEKLKNSTNDLISIQKDIEIKIIEKREIETENLNDLKKSLDNIQIQLQESIKKHEAFSENIHSENFLDSLLKKLDEIKPFFEDVLNKIKMYSHNLSSAIDITALELKLSYIYKVIFLREKKEQIINKAEEIKEKILPKN
ncbi:hypothetical protein GCL60_11305 [Silvanigrella paludirubra]|jgi:hypothetical protein|uniref:Uncharacterized protein n=1 Tax=Silvanigrella paludirubra TaxID=2499159 RepID=A0A6N6VRQ6_9BACT|nr:hypothetical protein [Silvanigrella paludirubra]KAB8037753.1 hypothetical protein GCL60_11305 [Silvanigrella paludirubra]